MDMYKSEKWKQVEPFKGTFHSSVGPFVRVTTIIESSVCPPTEQDVKDRVERIKKEMEELENEPNHSGYDIRYYALNQELHALQEMYPRYTDEMYG